ADVYASPEFISSLDTASAIANHVKVDSELWGCPVNSKQLIKAIRAYLFGVVPHREQDKVCLECKRQHNTCVVITKRLPCMGPVTVTGCGAICPKHGRDCYACYGPAENVNTRSLSRCFEGLGLTPDVIEKKFHLINSASPEFRITKE
ncbi:MAG: sulfhydrogenase subunit delta, partial [Gammaproteobacteria bacterium]